MEPIIKQVHKSLIKKRKTVAVAESCTGGLLSKLLTDLPGSSQYFLLGVICYSNQVKSRILKVPAGLVKTKGAVSQEVALRMAVSVKKLAKADYGIGITGIAGPSGGTSTKPVGTVFIAIANSKQESCSKFNLKGSRNKIRKEAALKALEFTLNF